jgi:small subunit ribosomal protein S4
MATISIPPCKQCRREGQKLFLKGERCFTTKCAIVKRNYAPGQHGQTTNRKRTTGYGTQLREKQKAKRTYGVLERQFRLYYERAKRMHGQTGELMLVTLESRLDNVLYRAGFAASRSQARQLVSHAQLLLNGKAVNIASMQVKSGDVITVKPHKSNSAYWKQVLDNQLHTEIPVWLSVDRKGLSITVSQAPTAELINSELQMNLIVELYSL